MPNGTKGPIGAGVRVHEDRQIPTGFKAPIPKDTRPVLQDLLDFLGYRTPEQKARVFKEAAKKKLPIAKAVTEAIAEGQPMDILERFEAPEKRKTSLIDSIFPFDLGEAAHRVYEQKEKKLTDYPTEYIRTIFERVTAPLKGATNKNLSRPLSHLPRRMLKAHDLYDQKVSLEDYQKRLPDRIRELISNEKVSKRITRGPGLFGAPPDALTDITEEAERIAGVIDPKDLGNDELSQLFKKMLPEFGDVQDVKRIFRTKILPRLEAELQLAKQGNLRERTLIGKVYDMFATPIDILAYPGTFGKRAVEISGIKFSKQGAEALRKHIANKGFDKIPDPVTRAGVIEQTAKQFAKKFKNQKKFFTEAPIITGTILDIPVAAKRIAQGANRMLPKKAKELLTKKVAPIREGLREAKNKMSAAGLWQNRDVRDIYFNANEMYKAGMRRFVESWKKGKSVPGVRGDETWIRAGLTKLPVAATRAEANRLRHQSAIITLASDSPQKFFSLIANDPKAREMYEFWERLGDEIWKDVLKTAKNTDELEKLKLRYVEDYILHLIRPEALNKLPKVRQALKGRGDRFGSKNITDPFLNPRKAKTIEALLSLKDPLRPGKRILEPEDLITDFYSLVYARLAAHERTKAFRAADDYILQKYGVPIAELKTVGIDPKAVTYLSKTGEVLTEGGLSQSVVNRLLQGKKLTKPQQKKVSDALKAFAKTGRPFGQAGVSKPVSKLSPRHELLPETYGEIENISQAFKEGARSLPTELVNQIDNTRKVMRGQTLLSDMRRKIGDIPILPIPGKVISEAAARKFPKGVTGAQMFSALVDTPAKTSMFMLSQIFPQFHSRNFFSESFYMFWNAGLGGLKKENHLAAGSILAGKNLNTRYKAFDGEYSYNELMRIMQNRGWMDSELATFIGGPKNLKGFEDFLHSEIYAPGGMSFGSRIDKVKRKIGSWSTYVDNYAKSVSFLSALKRMPMRDAIKHVENFHVNYNRLTGPEKVLAKRLFMFYTWPRTNTINMLKQIKNNPKMFRAIYMTPRAITEPIVGVEPDEVKRFREDIFGGPGYIGYDPVQGRQKFVTGLAPVSGPIEAVDFVSDPLRVLSQTHPILKGFIERYFNINLFTKRPLYGPNAPPADRDMEVIYRNMHRVSPSAAKQFADLLEFKYVAYKDGKSIGEIRLTPPEKMRGDKLEIIGADNLPKTIEGIRWVPSVVNERLSYALRSPIFSRFISTMRSADDDFSIIRLMGMGRVVGIDPKWQKRFNLIKDTDEILSEGKLALKKIGAGNIYNKIFSWAFDPVKEEALEMRASEELTDQQIENVLGEIPNPIRDLTRIKGKKFVEDFTLAMTKRAYLKELDRLIEEEVSDPVFAGLEIPEDVIEQLKAKALENVWTDAKTRKKYKLHLLPAPPKPLPREPKPKGAMAERFGF